MDGRWSLVVARIGYDGKWPWVLAMKQMQTFKKLRYVGTLQTLTGARKKPLIIVEK